MSGVKPTKEQLAYFDRLLSEYGDSKGIGVETDALRALRDDYRARGEALRMIRAVAPIDHEVGTLAKRALEGAGDEHG